MFHYRQRDNSFPAQEHEEAMARSQPMVEMAYNTRAPTAITTQARPIQVGTFNNSHMRVNFNYQSLHPPREYPNPVSPISQLVTPFPMMKKVTSMPDETERHH